MAKCLEYGPAGGSGSFGGVCPWGSVLHPLFPPSRSFFLSLPFIYLLGPQVPVTTMFCPNVWGQVTMEQTLWSHKTKPVSLLSFLLSILSQLYESSDWLCLSAFRNPERAHVTSSQSALTSPRWCLLLPVAMSPAALALLEPNKKGERVRKV